MSNKRLEIQLLRKFYEATKDGGKYFPKGDDCDPPVTKLEALASADRLAERGLIEWHPLKGHGRETSGRTIEGWGSIAESGRRAIENPFLVIAGAMLRHPMLIALVAAVVGAYFTGLFG